MQDTQAQLKDLSRKVEDKIEGKGRGGGGGGGGGDAANELAALTAKMYEVRIKSVN